jgi:hypothetical protein
MCPVCIATAAVIASSAGGTGGLTAFVAHKILRKRTGLIAKPELVYPGAANLKSMRPTGSGDLANARNRTQ